MGTIGHAIDRAVSYLTEHPNEARYTDSVARATLGESLRVTVEGPGGEQVATDMPQGVGGLGEHPSPGWLFRAAIASCVASTVAMEAARAGVTLDSLEVEVDSVSDDRGILGMDADIPPGPISTSVRVMATAGGVERSDLSELVERGAHRCPVCDATKRAVEVSVEVSAT